MSKQIEALKLALEAFGEIEWSNNSQWQSDRAKVAITAIKEALAQPEQLREENERLHVENRRLIDRIESIGVPVGVGGFATTTLAQPEQEPVGKFAKFTDDIWREVTDGSKGVPLYIAPQRIWDGLTEDEAFACQGRDYFETYKAIEAKLRSKNS